MYIFNVFNGNQAMYYNYQSGISGGNLTVYSIFHCNSILKIQKSNWQSPSISIKLPNVGVYSSPITIAL